VERERAKIFAVMNSANFDPRQEVILEQEPVPQPVPASETGFARILESSTDHLTIEAQLKSPAILLVTDSYSKDWKARPLPDSSQQNYEVLPANYCLRAVPLGTGKHRFRLEYLPAAFVVGRWVTVISLVGYFGWLLWWWMSRRVVNNI
jgi:uncharacterized membrane protein YfhO